MPGPHRRVIYLEAKLFEQVMNPGPEEYRFGKLWQDFDHVSHGRRLTVGYGVERTCMLKQLDPRADEVWELRSKDPEPQVRVFGRFAETDVFIATHAEYRDKLGDPAGSKFDDTNRWPAEIQRCHTIWNRLFLYEPPVHGATINEYISSNVVEVGRLP